MLLVLSRGASLSLLTPRSGSSTHTCRTTTTKHARIAKMFLEKRKELGAENAPTIVVGDMNSHASHFNQVEGGGFESNLEANGFTWAYTAKGNPGYGRIDQLLYSS